MSCVIYFVYHLRQRPPEGTAQSVVDSDLAITGQEAPSALIRAQWLALHGKSKLDQESGTDYVVTSTGAVDTLGSHQG